MDSSLIEMPKTDIIIVNWNAGNQLRECIDSIRREGFNHVGKCIVVDNGSQDGSTGFLEGANDVDLVLTDENLGFGRACNLGAELGGSEFVLFLNPDAMLMPGSLDVPLTFLKEPQNDKVGIVGVALMGEDGEVQRTCAKSPTPLHLIAKSCGISALFRQADFQMKAWDHCETRPVDQVMGAFFLVRRNLFQELRGFDERFFVYFEEVDFSRRAADAGFGTIFLTEACAYHKGGGVSEQVKAHRLFYSLRSRIKYAFKHFSWASALLVACAALVVEPITRLFLLLLQRRFGEIGDMMRGYRMIWEWVVSTTLGSQKTR